MGPIAPKPGDITLESSLKGQEAAVTPLNDAQEADSLENQSPGINKFELSRTSFSVI
jgi:hypothetical protein